MDKLKELFSNPSSEYRSIPFWAWNDKLEEDELIYQIKEMKRQGIGGFFMHSREGLETEYLSSEWFELIKKCVETAKAEGMEAWLYDEDRWPSGTAGGTVTRTGGNDSRCKGLTIEVGKEVIETSEIVAIFKAKVSGMNIIECDKLNVENIIALKEDEVYLTFRIEVSEPSEWFNNEAPPDNLNAKSVKRFIESTYEAYRQAIGEEFGKTIKGMFTDEPSLADRNSKFNPKRGWIPWTYTFAQYFKDKRGYDLLDFIPYFYFNCDKSSFVRHDYWRTVTELFTESYSKQIGEWCRRNNIRFTGHFLQEDKLGLATRVGGAVMPHYVYQDVPGIDLLCEKTDEYITVRQCTSVANQYGKKVVISETYGCTGWDFTFEGQKWIGDWQFVMGINRRCQHLALYSIKGCRKRDYPPVFNYNTSWWKYDKVVEDYFARLSAVLTEGKPVRDILIIHPSTSAWSMLGTDPYGNPKRAKERDVPAINAYGKEFNDLLKYLMAVHYDYDLGDEMLIEKDGVIKENKFCIKLAAYKVVVLPPLKTMLRSTLKLLISFLKAGGIVIAIKPFATMVEGRQSIDKKADKIPNTFEAAGYKEMYVSKDEEQLVEMMMHNNFIEIDYYTELSTELEKVLHRKVSIKNEYDEEVKDIFYMFKEAEDFKTLFLVNNSRTKSFDTNIYLNEVCDIEEWDPLTGQCFPVVYKVTNDKISVKCSFNPAASRLFILKKFRKAGGEEVNIQNIQLQESFYTSLGPVFSFDRTLPNSLTLDKCCYVIGEGKWSEEMEVWQAQKNIRNSLEMCDIYYNGLPQRYKWVNKSHPKDGTEIKLLFNFKVEDLPNSETYIVIEDSQNFTISLNGAKCENTKNGYFIDKSFHKVLLKGLIKGENKLILSCKYSNRMELEDCYLIGDFAISKDRTIVKEPSTLKLGDWCLQGYPHYAGSMIYKYDFNYEFSNEGIREKKLLMEVGDFSATVINVKVNNEQAGFIPWKARNIIDITDLVVQGKNTVYIEVMGSMRNLLGPFHQKEGKTLTTDWSSFRTEGSDYLPDYNLKPYGIFELIRLYTS